MTPGPDPRRRGQPAEPQAGPRRAGARRLRGRRGDTGEEGVALAAEQPPDLVLMDLQLPGIDGTEALRRLRADGRDRRRPGRRGDRLRDAEDRERAVRAGFDGYLEKPISVRALPGQVRGFLAPDGRR